MYLLAIVVALCIERLINPGFFMQRFGWFTRYVDYVYPKFGAQVRAKGMLSACLLLLPLVALIALLFYGLLFYQMLQALLAIVALTYCLGPEDSRRQLEGYIKAKQDNDAERARVYTSLLYPGALPTDEPMQSRALTEVGLQLFVRQIFAVIIWFLLLGPVGAVLYRSATMLQRYAYEHNLAYILHAAQRIVKALDWLPVRLLGFSFALVGNFNATFNFVCKHCFTSINNNEFLLNNAGILAIGSDTTSREQTSFAEHQALLSLFDRVLIIWLVAIALVTLGLLAA